MRHHRFLTTHVVGIKNHGFSYVKHFLGPVWWLAPFMFFVEIIGHLSRPLSLSFRLFGNMNGHELILIIFFTLVPFLVPLPMMLLGVLIAFLQSFVFMLLATIYIQGSLEESH
jgi:F-type H+-transporting ATPase subunit a